MIQVAFNQLLWLRTVSWLFSDFVCVTPGCAFLATLTGVWGRFCNLLISPPSRKEEKSVLSKAISLLVLFREGPGESGQTGRTFVSAQLDRFRRLSISDFGFLPGCAVVSSCVNLVLSGL